MKLPVIICKDLMAIGGDNSFAHSRHISQKCLLPSANSYGECIDDNLMNYTGL
ncbi:MULTISPECIES: hypothetical protein [unclassified Lentilitoribacter]|uniref:hypothetical protein n=1 Tax=unclassified Lentilitoribacter TaxID=2647570 RepID=UPI0013A6B599|nr:hypothetical protein [Lentilitoribacter sp. Alg239-R112]